MLGHEVLTMYASDFESFLETDNEFKRTVLPIWGGRFLMNGVQFGYQARSQELNDLTS